MSSVLISSEVLSSPESFFLPGSQAGCCGALRALGREMDSRGPKAKVLLAREPGGKEMHPKIAASVLGQGF